MLIWSTSDIFLKLNYQIQQALVRKPLSKVGIEMNFLNLIKEICKKPTTNILIMQVYKIFY